MKDIKDYLHLYLGCDVAREHSESRSKKFFEHAKLIGITASEVEKGKTVAILEVGLDHFHEWYVEETKPILRPLSDMTNEERVILKYYNNDASIPDKLFNAAGFWFLLSKHFDLFGLTDAGLAIEKSIEPKVDKL